MSTFVYENEGEVVVDLILAQVPDKVVLGNGIAPH
jgi:hypothetical protein